MRLVPTALALALLALPGCLMLDVTPAEQDVVPWVEPAGRSEPFARVLLPPLSVEDGLREEERLVRDDLQAAITRRALFEAVPVENHQLSDLALTTARERGVYAREDLILLNKRFGVDGVLAGVLTRYRAYPSVQLGLRILLIDCRNGRVAFSSDVLLDGADVEVAKDVHNWYDVGFADRNVSLLEHEKVLVSPRLFSRYATTRVIDAMKAALESR